MSSHLELHSTQGSFGECGLPASLAETAPQANVFELPVWSAWPTPEVRRRSDLPFSARARRQSSALTDESPLSLYSGSRDRPACASAHSTDQFWARAT